jgi:hypothetical protein
MSNQCHTTLQTMGTPEVEVMGVLGTEFLSLDELAPGQDWDDLLAAQWGIPCATTEVAKTDRPSWIKAGRSRLRLSGLMLEQVFVLQQIEVGEGR